MLTDDVWLNKSSCFLYSRSFAVKKHFLKRPDQVQQGVFDFGRGQTLGSLGIR